MEAQLFVVLALALCCASSVTATLNMSHVCLLVGNDISIASDVACNTYYTCSGGVATMQTCDSPLYFDKDTQSCVPQSQVNCLGSNPCAGNFNGSWVAAPDSCTDFYYCGASGAVRGQCPSGENFDASTMSCEYSSDSACEPPVTDDEGDANSGITNVALNLCTLIKNGVYFGSASSCSAWNFCNNNQLTSGVCGSGLVFDVLTGQCDYTSDWACTQVTNDPELIGASGTTPLNGGTCTTSGTMKAAPNCAGFYLCDGTNFVLQQCTNDLYYDTISQTCVNRLQARNNCDRCAGTTDTFVNAYSTTECTGYLYCVNGVEQATGTCQSGYFNEVAGACVIGTEPQFACCNPSGSSGTTVADDETTTEGSGAAVTTTVKPEAAVTTTVKAGAAVTTTVKAGADVTTTTVKTG